jgi:hypothetical protein
MGGFSWKALTLKTRSKPVEYQPRIESVRAGGGFAAGPKGMAIVVSGG